MTFENIVTKWEFLIMSNLPFFSMFSTLFDDFKNIHLSRFIIFLIRSFRSHLLQIFVRENGLTWNCNTVNLICPQEGELFFNFCLHRETEISCTKSTTQFHYNPLLYYPYNLFQDFSTYISYFSPRILKLLKLENAIHDVKGFHPVSYN